MKVSKKLVSALVLGALVVAGGGWVLAKQHATAQARDLVDGFLIREGLNGRVSYADLSASPFGSVSLLGVTVTLSPDAVVRATSVDVSDIALQNGEVRKARLSASDADVPVLAMARANRYNPVLRDLVSLGYTSLRGDVSLLLDYDDQRQSLFVETSGSVRDAGGWNARLRVEGVDPAMVATARRLASGSFNPLELMGAATQNMDMLFRVALAEADVTVDNSGVRRREREIVATDFPPKEDPSAQRRPPLDPTALIRAGMAPEAARMSAVAMGNWVKDGGKLRVATGLPRPVPMFKRGGPFSPIEPIFDSPEGFLAVTKATISN
ncbi:hypothetical protein ACCD06_26635 [Azospirillum sp. CT11-132]|uniref:hypothetical protein n=1 Tax=unclassified Azospirillum TaxID=2630922 RepID=UPI000D6143B0|nr:MULTISPECIES: hypothetical protein [unclassified Azospirillum]PWC57597.1 hypothetical protein TSH7_25405 [Azospirillum sp. TSH7]PWC67379.1 hypothetical protein TSH20_12580 [Azospirillum sp. TSH20]